MAEETNDATQQDILKIHDIFVRHGRIVDMFSIIHLP